MFRNFLKIATRNLLKRKGFTALNVIGLSLAIAVSLLLFTTVLQQFSFDHFHKNLDNLYVLYWQNNRPEGVEKSSGMPMVLAPTLKDEFPEITEVVRVQDNGGDVEYNGKIFHYGVDLVDTGYFKMFTFPIIEGNVNNPLPNINSIAIDEAAAKAIFGEDDPIGKTINWQAGGQSKPMTITAIMQKVPATSSLSFNLLARIENANSYNDPNWGNHNHGVYIQLPPSIKPAQFEERLRPFVRKHVAEEIEMMKNNGFIADAQGDVSTLKLYPLKEWHFASGLNSRGLKKILPIGLFIVGLFVLAIASINFVNLTIGTSIVRSLEVSVRKVMGADRKQVLLQFWGEALMIVLLASAIALMLVQWFLSDFNALLQSDVHINSPFLLAALAGVLLLVGLVAGGYPALVLSRFQAAEVLKRNTKMKTSGTVRNLLVTVQFVISITLIACTMVVLQQFDYLRNKPLGYNKNQVVSIPIGHTIEGQKALSLMRNELSGQPGVLSVTGAGRNLGQGKDGSITTSIIGWDQKGKTLMSYWLNVDYDYIETLDMELLEGRSFDRTHPADTSKPQLIVNEAFVKQMSDSTSAIGQLMETEPKSEIIGVVKDFHFNPLNEAIEPASLVLGSQFSLGYIFVKIAPENTPRTLSLLEEKWKKIAPQSEWQGTFLDENTQRQYKEEQTLSQIFAAAGGLTILLSCLGLFGIAVLTIVQRTKEIGIRKVLGATTGGLVGLLAKDFLKLVAIAAVFAIPLAWLAMREWLQNYYYRVELHWWVFAAAGVVAIAVAFLTVSVQSVRAALSNPVEALRAE
ncbi:MAG: ABC transporter permease [Lewinellaceae bacterium]|nr:ABC transporter permease [Saprospiraceae bacterium]MCB9338020.1 ABC transporter permease [Lewinellaceae bacterium]